MLIRHCTGSFLAAGSFLLPLLLASAACGPVPGARSTERDLARTAGPAEEYAIDNPAISESSGLARSNRSDGILWTHNDSGGNAEAYAVDLRGHFLGTLAVLPAANGDWEDMTSFVEDGTPRLLLADIGDNDAFRPFVDLYVVDEPDVSGQTQPFSLQAPVVRAIQVAYPDGSRDAESIAVDAVEGYIYILSKRDAVPKLYRVPLAPEAPAVMAEDLGEISIPRAPAGAANPESINWTTSMDIDASGRQLMVLTLTAAHLYLRAEGESWQAALQRAPQSFDLPDYPQIEACAFAPDGAVLWITSEGSPAPMARIPLAQ